MGRKYFGTDGVRGRVGESPITPEFVMHLGYAAGQVLVADRGSLPPNQHPTVLIGKDTRISGYMLEAALEAGFTAAGRECADDRADADAGGGLSDARLRLQAGVVISASHNPFEDNGIKFFSASGEKLPDSVEEAIEARHGSSDRDGRGTPVGTCPADRGCRGALYRVLQEHLPQSSRPARHAHRGGLRAWRDLSHRPACAARTGRRGHRRRQRAGWLQYQRPVRCNATPRRFPMRCASIAPIWALHSTAMATG